MESVILPAKNGTNILHTAVRGEGLGVRAWDLGFRG